MRVPLAFLTAVAALLAVTFGAPASSAAPSGPKPRTGTWKGTTSQGLPISFVVGHGKVKGGARDGYFYIKSAKISASMTCEDASVVNHTVKLIAGKVPTTGSAPKGAVAEIMWGPGTTFVFRGLVASAPWAGVGVRWEGTFTSPRRVTGGTHGLNISIPDAGGVRGRCNSRDFGWDGSWKKKR